MVLEARKSIGIWQGTSCCAVRKAEKQERTREREEAKLLLQQTRSQRNKPTLDNGICESRSLMTYSTPESPTS